MVADQPERLSQIVDLLALHQREPKRFPFLFHSGSTAGPTARFHILFADPVRTVQGAPLAMLPELERPIERPPAVSHLPFLGGWVLYLAYELAGHFESRLQLPQAAGLPVARATRCEAAIIVDLNEGCTWLVGGAAQKASFRQLIAATPVAGADQRQVEVRVLEDPDAAFLDGVHRCLDWIRAGDIYQLNLSRRWRLEAEGLNPARLFRRLIARNPAPFSALALWPDMSIVSSSPERLLLVDEGRISTRPIAGTRPRGQGSSADAALRTELHSNPKERAEHIMLIDLERNDLGRICRAGSVSVDELLALESYASVHHIVSSIRGELRPQIQLTDILRAVFPGGTITGCPKFHCMERIAELEGRPRGAYTGSLGYISDHGRMDMNILIRSLVAEQGQWRLDAGAGIVADSDPHAELAETRAKARAVLDIFRAV